MGNIKKSNFNIGDLTSKIPLDVRLRVSTQMGFINLITELGYREDKMWSDEEDDVLNKLIDLANELAEDHLKEVKEWIEDGQPE